MRFDSSSNVDGYEPDRYLQMYEEADGAKPRDRINAMRREFYQENREKILEQKRDAYAKQQELESSAAEEVNL